RGCGNWTARAIAVCSLSAALHCPADYPNSARPARCDLSGDHFQQLVPRLICAVPRDAPSGDCMMRYFKQRRAPVTQLIEPRTRRLTIIRWVYLASMFVLAGWLANFFFGDLLYLRSEGLVIGQPSVVAAEFPVTVRDLLVREGEQVKAGQVAAVVTSQEVLETIARLSADIAARQVRLGELRIRDQTIDAMLVLAQDRDKVAASARQEFEKLVQQGYQSIDKRTAAVESEYRSRQDLESLKAEKRSVDEELKILNTVLGEAQSALRDLRRNYDEGRLRVSIDGIVSRVSVDRGAVVRAGEPLVEI